MQSDTVAVRQIKGRYPESPAVLRSDNMQVSVEEVARIVRIRIDDAENPEAWMEITLEVER